MDAVLKTARHDVNVAPHVESRVVIPDAAYGKAEKRVKYVLGMVALEKLEKGIVYANDPSQYSERIDKAQGQACGGPSGRIANNWIWAKLGDLEKKHGIRRCMMHAPRMRRPHEGYRYLYKDARYDMGWPPRHT